uniref:Uncharacterized protein n=1 Tax=Homalodisca liturata TaxID=320908 RepID=A0A1B6IUN1_9HEMI
MLCELNSKVVWEQAETKKKSEEYKAGIQNAMETWKSYQAIYEELPMAMKLRGITMEVRKVDIEIRQTVLDIEDVKCKIKLKDEIRAKIFHKWGVELAEAYFKLQKQIAKRDTLMEKISETKKLIEDGKAGRHTSQQTFIQNTPGSVNIQEPKKINSLTFLQLKIPDMQVILSPPSMNTVQSNVTGIKNFESLLQSYNLYSRSKQDIAKKTTDNISANNTIIAQATNSNKRFPTSKKDTFCTVSNNLDAKKMSTTKLSFKINNPMTSLKNKNKDRVERLVANIDNNQILNENQSNRLEPPKKVMIVEALPSKSVTTISTDTNKSISNNFVKSNNVENESNSAKKKISNENALNMNNSIQLDCNLGSLYGIKKYISSLTADQNRTQELYQAQTTSQNVTSNVSPNKQLEITSVYNDQNISNKTQSPKPNSQQPNSKVTESYQLNIQLNQQTENDMFESETSENHSKNVTVSMMDPNSVPDIIPVENVSQSLSQNSSDRCLSQSLTDFTSPVELDEATKLAYQRLAAESPGFVYPRGPDMLEAQAREVQMSAPVRSQYFSSTPATVMQDSYQPTPYSPPTHINTSSVLSPPAGNLGMFSFGKDTSQNSCDKQMEKQKSPDGGFNFNFMSGPSSSSSSFFSLF